MKCLMRFNWVKLQRSFLPKGKGIMGYWSKLASRAAFRKGHATYCGYKNEVIPGMWSGGIVGVKSILGVRSRRLAFEILDKLSELGYITYTLDQDTKKLTYYIKDWVVRCSGAECADGAVYTTDGYGFICLPRNITEKLIEKKYVFEESDAWLDIWCHTVSEDKYNAFSFLSPAFQYGKKGTLVTLEALGKRWRWNKTKVWRFFRKYADTFMLKRLPGSYGCVIFNLKYSSNSEPPSDRAVMRILREIRICAENTQKFDTDHEHIRKMIMWYSRQVVMKLCLAKSKNGVSQSDHIIRAYISHCWNCKSLNDCGNIYSNPLIQNSDSIRGPTYDLTEIAKEFFDYG